MHTKTISVKYATGQGVAERWKDQYCRDGKWRDTYTGSSEAKYNRLVALGECPDIDSVAGIMGNKTWSYFTCANCFEDVAVAVLMGEPFDHKLYCKTCILTAASVFSAEKVL